MTFYGSAVFAGRTWMDRGVARTASPPDPVPLDADDPRISVRDLDCGGHAFIQSLRRGHHVLGAEARHPLLRLPAAIDELTLAVCPLTDDERCPGSAAPAPMDATPPPCSLASYNKPRCNDRLNPPCHFLVGQGDAAVLTTRARRPAAASGTFLGRCLGPWLRLPRTFFQIAL